MAEITPSHEKPQIPENWKFPERNNPNLEIIQVEPGARFLAVDIPRPAWVEDRQYFFDRNGKISHFLHKGLSWTEIGITAEVIKSQHLIDPTARVVNINFPDLRDKEENFPRLKLEADICYREGKPFILRMNNLFINSDRLGIIKSPVLGIYRDKDLWVFKIGEQSIPTGDPSNEFRIRETNFHIMQSTNTDNSGSLDVFDGEEKKVFEIKYGQEGDVMFITQTHTTGIVKTIKAPIAPDWEAVSDAVNANPPYAYEKVMDMKHLVVPWREINRIIGAGISYSYPRPGNKR